MAGCALVSARSAVNSGHAAPGRGRRKHAHELATALRRRRGRLNVPMDLESVRTQELLRLYSEILSELLRRGVIRSRNAPVGDLAEHLVAISLGGELAPPSAKSWDVQADGRRLQVKARVIVNGDRRSHNYSVFRSWEFDACVFVLLDASTYDIVRAAEVPVQGVQMLARETKWVRAFRIGTKVDLLAVPGAVDRTAELRQALHSLG